MDDEKYYVCVNEKRISYPLQLWKAKKLADFLYFGAKEKNVKIEKIKE